MKKNSFDPFGINAFVTLKKESGNAEFSLERDVILKPQARNGSLIFFYQKKDGENLTLVPVKQHYAVTMISSNPMASAREEDLAIVILEIHHNRIVAREIGLIRIGRGNDRKHFVVERPLWNAPYALTEENTLQVEGLTFKPLLQEIERAVKENEVILRPSYQIEGAFKRNEPLSREGGKDLRGAAIRVLDWNPLRGSGHGIDAQGKSLLLELNQFQDPKDAILRLNPGMILFAGDRLALDRKGKFDFRACAITIPKPKEPTVTGGAPQRKGQEV